MMSPATLFGRRLAGLNGVNGRRGVLYQTYFEISKTDQERNYNALYKLG